MVACTYEHMNATYDLSPLLKIGGAYHVSDEYDGAHSTRNYTYAMNVCGAVDPRELPASCADKGEGNAWQVSSDDAYCYRLGATATAFSPLDATDPSRGVRLTYAGGEACGALGPRTFALDLVCKDRMANIPDRFHEYVEELTSTPCQYEMELETIYACPRQCEIGRSSAGDLRLCSGNGVCAYDAALGSPACFCYGDYDGSDCSTIQTKKACGAEAAVATGTIIGLVFISLFLAIIFAAVAFLLRETRRNNVTYGLLLDQATGRNADGGTTVARKGQAMEVELC